MNETVADRVDTAAGSLGRLLRCSEREATEGRKLDWTGILELAGRQKLEPLLYHQLIRRVDKDRFPPSVIEHLRHAYYLGADRNIRRYHRLQPLLARLRDKDIPVIALKGACLAESVYPNIALRPMSDVDLLIPKHELAKARSVMVEAGCVHQPDADIDRLCRISHQLSVFIVREPADRTKSDRRSADPINSFSLELHWTIETPTGPFTIPVAGLWNRSRPTQVAGVEVLSLSPEDLLLHVCLHAGYHHGLGAGLLPCCDMAFIIERYRAELDWPEVVRRACEWGAARYVGLVLVLARDLLGADVPEGITDKLIGGTIDRRITEAAQDCVLKGESCLRKKPTAIHVLLGNGSVKERLEVLRYRLSERGRRFRSAHKTINRYPVFRLGAWLLVPALLCRGTWRWILRPLLARLLTPTNDRRKQLADWLNVRCRPWP